MRDLIQIVVETFYQKALNDVLIGYHFSKFQDKDILHHHLERITTFWEMQLTGQSSVALSGKPFQLLFTHLQLAIKKGELGRWVVLFHQTLDELEQEMKSEGADLKELENIQLIIKEWKKRIQFFEERFKSHPQMFMK
jgi:truncated hemoglobin YjbI